ncbi:MAG TPA: lamin tail domain-containing protein, partial [Mycobacterium sp.]
MITATGHTIRLTVWPEEFVIAPDPAPSGTDTGPRPRAAGYVVILAALLDPAGVDRGHETITLINTTATGIDLTGWHLADAAGGKHALTGDLAGGAVSQVTLSGRLTLGNKGDTLILSDANGATIDTVTYTASHVPPRPHHLLRPHLNHVAA